ncbi:hypothetical protein [Serratia fonticola]|uniref:hypothetical protein n=1 Tax=Serratia fonticola TaxID=47917 RepID=UPI001AE85A2C|nr:hypothetical protein [Serratia fonticola]MBP1010763.1 hypothetical protein [Serratia fonticola]
MINKKELKEAVKLFTDYRNISSETVEAHLALVEVILKKAENTIEKGLDNLSDFERGQMAFYASIKDEVKESVGKIRKYNKSVNNDYIEGMKLLSSLSGGNSNER